MTFCLSYVLSHRKIYWLHWNCNVISFILDFSSNYLGGILLLQASQVAECLGNLVLLLQYGLDRILGEEKSLALLARAIDPSQSAMMTDVVKLLSAICIVGEDNMFVIFSFS